MLLLLVFALLLLGAALLSGPAEGSLLSTAVLFLVAGFVLGKGMVGLIVVQPWEPLVAQFTGLALFSALFTDGMLAIVGVRPLAIALAMIRSGVPRRERLVAAWFGSKGFASIFYGVLILREGVPDGDRLFNLIAVVVVLSIVAHSSTDVIAARWLDSTGPEAEAAPGT